MPWELGYAKGFQGYFISRAYENIYNLTDESSPLFTLWLIPGFYISSRFTFVLDKSVNALYVLLGGRTNDTKIGDSWNTAYISVGNQNHAVLPTDRTDNSIVFNQAIRSRAVTMAHCECACACCCRCPPRAGPVHPAHRLRHKAGTTPLKADCSRRWVVAGQLSSINFSRAIDNFVAFADLTAGGPLTIRTLHGWPSAADE